MSFTSAGGDADRSFGQVRRSLLQDDGLPFAEALRVEHIRQAFAAEDVVRRLTEGVAERCEVSVPDEWRWRGFRTLVIDGTTFSMPDSEENQAEYPPPTSQAESPGFPILRATAGHDQRSRTPRRSAYPQRPLPSRRPPPERSRARWYVTASDSAQSPARGAA